MHLILAVLLAGGETPARFGADGLHLGPLVVVDATLSMTPDGRLLASRTQLESLGAPVPVDLGHGRILLVEPGLRVASADGGVTLTARLGRRVALTIAGERVVLASPATVAATADGLAAGGRAWAVAQAGAAPAQDDVDENMRKMEEAQKRVQPPPPPQTPLPAPPSRPGRFDWFRTFNPFVVSQPVSPVVVTSLVPISDIGF